MKKVIMLAFMIALAGVVQVNAQRGKPAEKETAEVNKSQEQKGTVVKLKVSGMTCAGCAGHVHKVLSETSGVLDNFVEYPGDIAVIRYDPEKIKPENIVEAIEQKTNYKAQTYKQKSESKN